jgi:hypothetical protein
VIVDANIAEASWLIAEKELPWTTGGAVGRRSL